MPADLPKQWRTFCVEGTVNDIETYLGTTKHGKSLVALASRGDALQVGYPEFVSRMLT